MKLLSFFTAAWMGILSLFGLSHPAVPGTAAAPTGEPPAAVPVGMTTPSPAATGTVSADSASSAAVTSAAADATMSALPSHGSAWQTSLPLGDYHYTTSGPKKGYIYLCNVMSGGQGAQGHATWISGSTWYPGEKVAVEGSVSWPNASYSMTVKGTTRLIVSNGLPTDHPTGIFPIQKTDPAFQFDGNPNTIEAQNYSFSLPASPIARATPQCIFGQVGIMNDGVPLFDGFDAEYRDAVAHETQDAWEGHPDANDTYHYHGFEGSYVKDSVSTVVGFAFDGYPITGAKLADGTYLTTNQLDECHGITSPVTLDGKTVTTYHYVLTQDFPYSVSCFHGKSYEPKPGPSGSGTTGTGTSGSAVAGPSSGTPPAAAITTCASLSSGASCSFATPKGTVSGTCKNPPSQSSLACVPNN